MKTLVESSRAVRFSIAGREALYKLVGRVLKAQRYAELAREQRGIVRRFLAKVTGRSRAQITRLIGQWMETRTIEAKHPARRRFATRYTETDARLLAMVDATHEELAGPAVKRILLREYEVFGHQEFARLAEISVSHLYNLRRSQAYRRVRVRVEHTRPSKVNIGERRKPQPLGRPGFLRVDTVHQGDWDGARVCITSMRWIPSRSGKWWAVRARSASSICCPFWKQSCISFPSVFWVFIQTMARNSSITRSPGCWRNCASSSPKAVPTERRTTRWWKARTAPLYASTSATATLRPSMPKACRSSTRHTSIPT